MSIRRLRRITRIDSLRLSTLDRKATVAITHIRTITQNIGEVSKIGIHRPFTLLNKPTLLTVSGQ